MLGITPGHLVVFALTALVIIAIPGPSVIFIVSRALANGRRVALLSVLGNVSGVYLHVIAVALGVGALVDRSLTLFVVLKLIGGLYLVYLGVRTYLARGSLSFVGSPSVAVPDGRAFRQALMVGASNPKGMIFMAAILPQFVVPAAGNVAGQVLALGFVFALVGLASDTAWALGAGAARERFARSPRRLAMVGGGGGVAIAAIGLGLIASGRGRP